MRRDDRDNGVVGIALIAAAGFGIGLVAGAVVGEMLGDMRGDRLRGIVSRLGRRPAAPPPDPATIQRAVRAALRGHPRTRGLDLRVHSVGAGLVELSGNAPDAVARRVAGELARAVPGAEVVVNRILVDGSDLPHSVPATPSES